MSERLTVRISTQYYSLSIHRGTLIAIGDPEYIQFGYKPEAKVLMLVGNIVDEENSIRVHYNKNGSCIVFSKGLIEGIRRVGGVLQERGSYLLTGRASDTLPIIYFELAGAVPSAADLPPATDPSRVIDLSPVIDPSPASPSDDHRTDAAGSLPDEMDAAQTEADPHTDEKAVASDDDSAGSLQESPAVVGNA